MRHILYSSFIALLFCAGTTRLWAQEVKHPDMELIENEQGEQMVVLLGTQQPPNPKLYAIKEETTAKGIVYVVLYKPTGEQVTFFLGTATIKGKSEAPGVSLVVSRVTPQIEKVIGQKSYEREIKKRYLDLVLIPKGDVVATDDVDIVEIDKIIKKRRN